MDPAAPATKPSAAARKRRRVWPWLLAAVAGVLAVAAVAGVALLAGGPNVPRDAVLELSLGGELPDMRSEGGLEELLDRNALTFPDQLLNLRKAAADKRIKGVLVRLEPPAFGWAKVEELRDALEAFKKSGKFVLAYSEGYDEKGYGIALAADEVLTVPAASFDFNGLSTHVIHYPGLLEKLGIEVQYFRYGKYKSISGETFGRQALTEPVKEMINHNLDVQNGLFLDAVAARRHLTREQAQALVEEGGLRAEWALEHKLIDGLVYEDELQGKLRQRLGITDAEKKVPTVKARAYRRVSGSAAGLPEGKETFALVYSQGLVVSGKGGTDPFSGGASQGSTPIIRALERARRDDDVKAVVFRVDSPGGAGLGCDLVRREVERVAKKKPVVVSMSDMAASGGYWVSMDATAIVAEPSTMTGSVGIWAVVPNLRGTYEKLGLHQEVFTRGPHADARILSRPMTEAEARQFDDALKASYDLFVELASQGRHKTHAAMEELAQGRTWLGQDALASGLVDRLGGLYDAVALAKAKAGLPKDEPVRLLPYGERRPLLQRLLADDEDESEALADQALRAAVARSSFSRVMQPLSGPWALAREVLAHEQTLMLVPELVQDIR